MALSVAVSRETRGKMVDPRSLIERLCAGGDVGVKLSSGRSSDWCFAARIRRAGYRLPGLDKLDQRHGFGICASNPNRAEDASR